MMEPHGSNPASFMSLQVSASVSILMMEWMRKHFLRMLTPRCTRPKRAVVHSYRFFKPEMNIKAVERQSIEQDLRRALERKEFTLVYQPILSLKSGAITGRGPPALGSADAGLLLHRCSSRR